MLESVVEASSHPADMQLTQVVHQLGALTLMVLKRLLDISVLAPPDGDLSSEIFRDLDDCGLAEKYV